MGVDECIDKYLDLSAEAFRLKRSKMDLLARGRDLWKADGKYRSECLAQEFRNAAMQAEDEPDALLFDPDAKCRVLVLCLLSSFLCPHDSQIAHPYYTGLFAPTPRLSTSPSYFDHTERACR